MDAVGNDNDTQLGISVVVCRTKACKLLELIIGFSSGVECGQADVYAHVREHAFGVGVWSGATPSNCHHHQL